MKIIKKRQLFQFFKEKACGEESKSKDQAFGRDFRP